MLNNNYSNVLDTIKEVQDCKHKILNWLNDECIEETDKLEITNLIENKEVTELRDRFYKDIEFGTGGLRGIMGQGFNRLNKYIVRRATQGFANYILNCGESAKKRGVAIAYDSRNNSQFFANEAASVLCANGISVHLFPTLQTTPALSYAIRKLNCTGGLCFTASHNPPAYNGIKVYWDDGAQIIPPQDNGILKEVFAVTEFKQAKYIPITVAKEKGLLNLISDDVLDCYFNDIKTLSVASINKNNTKNLNRNIKIVFTPLHGTGKAPALRALKEWGFNNVFVVPEQAEPDGNFPTVKKPNPEEKEALFLAIKYANQIGADIICATDPDSDRLALAVHSPKLASSLFKNQSCDNYVLLNGNQTGALLIDYILKNMSANKTLKPEHKIIKTIVTSDLHEHICKNYNVDIYNTLTGFKWIAGLQRSWEENNKHFEYLFGTEESYGYMPGRFVRDKDAISALCLTVEMVAELSAQNKTACDYLLEIFAKYGAWQEDLINVDLYGEEGVKKIQSLMARMRSNPITNWNGVKVKELIDYTNENTQKKYSIPHSNVIQLCLEDGSKISMRPSGTEPKLKYYVSVCTKAENVATAYQQTLDKIEQIRNLLNTFTNS
jgi:phosphoglucomutase